MDWALRATKCKWKRSFRECERGNETFQLASDSTRQKGSCGRRAKSFQIIHTAVFYRSPPGIFITEVLQPGDKKQALSQFDIARCKKLEGLARKGVYEVVLTDEVPDNGNILGTRFVLSIKMLKVRTKCTKPDM